MFITQSLSAQDSLFFRNGEKKSVKIKEISSATVKYIRMGEEMPLYTIEKQELLTIKFGNGSFESFSFPETKTYVSDSIILKGGGRFYQYSRPLNAKRLILICD